MRLVTNWLQRKSKEHPITPTTSGIPEVVGFNSASQFLKLASLLGLVARFGHGVFAVDHLERSGGFERQLIDVRRELVAALQDVLAGDDPARVRGHAAHRGDEARFRAA